MEETMLAESPLSILLKRREALKIGFGGVAALTGFSAVQRVLGQSCTLNPSQTEGPYWGDEMLSRSDIRSDPGSGVVQAGFPLRLGINLSEITGSACAPLAGAYIDVWHCNALGVYSDVAAQGDRKSTR